MQIILLIIVGLLIIGFVMEYISVIALVVGAIIIYKLFSWKGLLISVIVFGVLYLISKVKENIRDPEKYFSEILNKTTSKAKSTKKIIVNSAQDAHKKISATGIFELDYWKRKLKSLLCAKACVSVSDNLDESLNHKITFNMFETSVLPLNHHPIKLKSRKFKVKYLYILTVFVKKYSDCKWSNEILSDYYIYCFKNSAMLENVKKSIPGDVNIRFDILKIFLTCGWRKSKFFKQLLLDVLYVCKAIDNKNKGDIIFSEIASYYLKPQEKLINSFYLSLYDYNERSIDNDCDMKWYWKRNRDFLSKKRIKVLVAANMSAGKSTLINAIVGKKVNQTQNDSCTKKIHYIFNKAYYDGRNTKCDNAFSTNVSINDLLKDNDNNKTKYVHIGTSFINSELSSNRILLIDTPGVNTYSATEHKIMTEEEIENNKTEILLYVMNATNIGTDDESKQLIYIQKHFEGRIIFVVNKLDKFNAKEDSVHDTLDEVKQDLIEKGFTQPEVVPISAYAAYLAKMKIGKNHLDEDEEDEFERISRKMKKQEYQFDTYFPLYVQANVKNKKNDIANKMLFHSGVLQLENIIKQEKTV